jgi:hypothetical protein
MRRQDARDVTAQHARADRRQLIAAFQMQLYLPSRQQTQRRFNACAVGRDVNHRRFVARPDAHLTDAVHLGPSPRRSPALG